MNFSSYHQFARFVRRKESSLTSNTQRLLQKTVRIFYAIFRDVQNGEINLRATSLAFTTLLALVPLLAVSFSVLKAFGAYNEIEPILLHWLEPAFGVTGADISGRLIAFVNNLKVGLLGSVGFAMLFLTAILLVQKLESAFNHIWQIQRERSWLRRFSDYFSMLIIGPVLLFSSLGISATVLNSDVMQHILSVQPFGYLYGFIAQLLPYVLAIAAITFSYVFIPNTKVKLRAALTGGIIAGIVWQSASWAFAAFVVSSAQYTAIYSGFAILVLFVMWIYLNWWILLTGASIAYYIQHPEYTLSRQQKPTLSLMQVEYLALAIMQRVGQYFYQQHDAVKLQYLVKDLELSGPQAEYMSNLLQQTGLLRLSADERGYLPGKPLDTVTVAEALHAIRKTNQDQELPVHDAVGQLLLSIEKNITKTVGKMTLKDLALRDISRSS
ncbi:MAG: YihY/virulence factor BrkB family protein [Gammaproteobacteria bacterium]|nr:YihY/virulence factor BrkB family protein [Gammaproteobacteria bacterium]